MEQRSKTSDLVFTPSTEPYLGRELVHAFDNVICSCCEINQAVAIYTQANREGLTPLQNAACQIIPSGVHLALSIRELVRQGYLMAAATLLRSLLERAAIMSHIYNKPEDLSLWQAGWKYRKRPELDEMMRCMVECPDESAIKATKDLFNHAVHGDPIGSSFSLVDLDQMPGYASGKMLHSEKLCDFVCQQALCFTIVLMGLMAGLFPGIGQKGGQSQTDAQAS